MNIQHKAAILIYVRFSLIQRSLPYLCYTVHFVCDNPKARIRLKIEIEIKIGLKFNQLKERKSSLDMNFALIGQNLIQTQSQSSV